MIEHFIVTRFNLRVNSWNTTKNGFTVLTDEWMLERFNLFEEYCLPSVKNQSDQDFTWCIYLDNRTPTIYRKRIEASAATFTNICLFYVNSIGEMITSFQTYTREKAGMRKKLITSRLDNDDIIHRDFVKTIKSAAMPVNRAVIDLRKGLQLSIETDLAELRCIENSFNPFISLLEGTSNPETVISRMHHEWENEERIIVVEGTPLWIELVHQTNKLNTVSRQFQKLTGLKHSDFGLDSRKVLFEPTFKIVKQNIRLRTGAVLSRIRNLTFLSGNQS